MMIIKEASSIPSVLIMILNVFFLQKSFKGTVMSKKMLLQMVMMIKVIMMIMNMRIPSLILYRDEDGDGVADSTRDDVKNEAGPRLTNKLKLHIFGSRSNNKARNRLVWVFVFVGFPLVFLAGRLCLGL